MTTPTTPREPLDRTVYYGINDLERLEHTTVDDAVCYYLDDIAREDWPETLLVEGYRREPFEFNADYILDNALEQACELMDPDGDGSSERFTDAMQVAAREFAAVLTREFVPWACSKNGDDHIVNVLVWVQKNQPQWLTEKQ
jgi:hypothetical protein